VSRHRGGRSAEFGHRTHASTRGTRAVNPSVSPASATRCMPYVALPTPAAATSSAVDVAPDDRGRGRRQPERNPFRSDMPAIVNEPFDIPMSSKPSVAGKVAALNSQLPAPTERLLSDQAGRPPLPREFSGSTRDRQLPGQARAASRAYPRDYRGVHSRRRRSAVDSSPSHKSRLRRRDER